MDKKRISVRREETKRSIGIDLREVRCEGEEVVVGLLDDRPPSAIRDPYIHFPGVVVAASCSEIQPSGSSACLRC